MAFQKTVLILFALRHERRRLIDDPVPAASFRLVKRRVGDHERARQRFRILRHERKTDAGADRKLVAVDFDRLMQRAANFVAERAGRRAWIDGAGKRDQGNELVAAKPRNGRPVACYRSNTACDRRQHLVAHHMTEDVVDRLEAVEIDDEQGLGNEVAALVALAAAREHLPLEKAAVRQPRQTVEIGKPLEFGDHGIEACRKFMKLRRDTRRKSDARAHAARLEAQRRVHERADTL